MQSLRSFLAPLLATVLVFSVFGCEIVAAIDRNKIPDGQGGSTPGSTQSSSGSSQGGGGGSDQGSSGSSSSDCTVPTDCQPQASECSKPTCSNGKCGTEFTPEGTVTPTQNAGDCKQNQCDGAGKVVAVNNDSDVLDDQNDCTDNVCVNGAPSNPPLAAGEMCGSGKTLLCDGKGACIGCLKASDCSGQNTDCQTVTCAAGGICGFSFTDADTPTSQQTAKDCKQTQCDGAGGEKIATDNLDLPVDGNECTDDVCTSGVPSNPPLSSGTTCTQGGLFCNGGGACVQCLVAATCPGQDTDCQTRICDSGACSFNFANAGTPVGAQIAGDCKESQCNGSGGEIVADKDGDLPVDSNDCTSDVCTAGVPSNPPVALGTACGMGLVCDATGTCVGCNTALDCPGQDTECQTRSCTATKCGFSFANAGTPVGAQTAGDCKENQCDGSGGEIVANKDGDLPVDNNQCTDDVCTSGAPSNPPLTSGTTCTQGGAFCDGSGACVECVVASTCPGQDTDCQIRACSNGACGVAFTPPGTVTSTQTPGDCKQNQCNGSGGEVPVDADGDVPIDSVQCTSDVCTGGVPSNPPVAAGSVCNQGGGLVCDGNGGCVECLVASTCDGQDTDCQTRTCDGGACGFSFAASGTPTVTQTAGDCHEDQCNGSGGVVTVVKDGDLPVDSNQCTDDICTTGVPSNPPVVAGTSCGPGLVCDANGACVGCNTATDCPGQDTECQTRSCTSGACGLIFTAAGTPVAAQTAGDCKQNQCDGAGAIVGGDSDTDVLVDNNECTDDVCTAGVPSNPPLASGSPCNQSGGLVCNGAGSCVECVIGATCPDNVCQNNVCQMATCTDNVKNAAESDVDCGGGTCPVCAKGKTCTTGTDCQTGGCINGVCNDVLLLSEVQSRGTNGENDEFIEIYNPTNVSVPFDSSWTVSARGAIGTLAACGGNLTVQRFAGLGQVIPPHGHLLITNNAGGGYNGPVSGNGTYLTSIFDGSSVVLKHGVDVMDAVCFFFIPGASKSILQTCSTPYVCEGAPVSNAPHSNSGGGASDVDVTVNRKPGGAAGNGQDTNDNLADFAGNTMANPQSLTSAPTP